MIDVQRFVPGDMLSCDFTHFLPYTMIAGKPRPSDLLVPCGKTAIILSIEYEPQLTRMSLLYSGQIHDVSYANVASPVKKFWVVLR